MPLAIVDAGPLYAAADMRDADHDASLEVLGRPELQLVIPVLIVAEVAYLLTRRLGPRAEAAFLRGLLTFNIEAPTVEDWARITDIVDQYIDFPLGGADASVVALAERLNTDIVITLDRRHFGAVRPRHCAAFRILPE